MKKTFWSSAETRFRSREIRSSDHFCPKSQFHKLNVCSLKLCNRCFIEVNSHFFQKMFQKLFSTKVYQVLVVCGLPELAGFVYKSFRIDTNQVLWDFWPNKLNPWYKSIDNRSTNQIHNMNLLKTGLWIESTIYIFWMP